MVSLTGLLTGWITVGNPSSPAMTKLRMHGSAHDRSAVRTGFHGITVLRTGRIDRLGAVRIMPPGADILGFVCAAVLTITPFHAAVRTVGVLNGLPVAVNMVARGRDGFSSDKLIAFAAIQFPHTGRSASR